MRSECLSSPAAALAALVGLLSVCQAGHPAFAEPLQDRGTAADQEACTPDVFRLCSDRIPDEAQILGCLQSKRDQLSPACGLVFTPAHDMHRRRAHRSSTERRKSP